MQVISCSFSLRYLASLAFVRIVVLSDPIITPALSLLTLTQRLSLSLNEAPPVLVDKKAAVESSSSTSSSFSTTSAGATLSAGDNGIIGALPGIQGSAGACGTVVSAFGKTYGSAVVGCTEAPAPPGASTVAGGESGAGAGAGADANGGEGGGSGKGSGSGFGNGQGSIQAGIGSASIEAGASADSQSGSGSGTGGGFGTAAVGFGTKTVILDNRGRKAIAMATSGASPTMEMPSATTTDSMLASSTGGAARTLKNNAIASMLPMLAIGAMIL